MADRAQTVGLSVAGIVGVVVLMAVLGAFAEAIMYTSLVVAGLGVVATAVLYVVVGTSGAYWGVLMIVAGLCLAFVAGMMADD